MIALINHKTKISLLDMWLLKKKATQKPTISKAQYGNYFEERYSNNSISVKAHIIKGELEGEYRKYNPQGKCVWVKYFNSGYDVTSEIIEFLGLKCTPETIHTSSILKKSLI
ncbi:hypothetical protein [Salmonella phage SD-1_S14]|nr:hypothetical protein [Salmonella phage SD-1_S14]